MNIEEKVKMNLLTRGFENNTQLNNRGLIGATIDETILIMKKIIEQNAEMQKFITDCFTFKNVIPIEEHVKKILKTQKIKTFTVDGITYVKNPLIERFEQIKIERE